MFDRFNDTARRVVARAGEESRALGHETLNTSHLLLALLSTSTGDGLPNRAADIIQDITDLAGVRGQILAPLPRGTQPTGFGHLPFDPDFKLAMEAAIRAANTLGDNHVGPEHLLVGLSQVPDSHAAGILGALGLTYVNVLALVKHSFPVANPTKPRSYPIYIATGESIDPASPKFFPSLELATAAHPAEEIAPFRLPLSKGEFFEVSTRKPELDIHGRFASYPDAFAVADALDGAGMKADIRIMTPRVVELRGQDSRGHDVVLGQTIEYVSSRILTHLAAYKPTPEEEPTHV